MSEKQTVIIDSQILTAYMRCSREFDFRFIQLLTQQDKDENLETGSLIHVMLKIYYTLKRSMKFTHEECVNISIELSRPVSVTMNLDQFYTEELTEHFKSYAKFYSNESWIPLNVEEPFSFILYEDEELRIIYFGVMDLYIENFGQKYPVDHKTERRKSDPLELDNQFLGYCAATGSNVLYVNKIGLQKTLKPEEKYRRIPLSYTPARIAEWKSVAVWYAKEYLLSLQEHVFPPRYTSCLRYGKKCQYYVLCNSDAGEIRDWKAQENFVKGEQWNPYTRDTELDKLIDEVIASK